MSYEDNLIREMNELANPEGELDVTESPGWGEDEDLKSEGGSGDARTHNRKLGAVSSDFKDSVHNPSIPRRERK